jgi:hypothetical protein
MMGCKEYVRGNVGAADRGGHPIFSAGTCFAGCDSVEAAGSDPTAPLGLPRLESPLSRALHAVLDAVRQERASFMRLRILKRGDPLEPQFFNSLVEDRSPAGMSYVEYLCHVHRQIQNKFS